MEPIKDLLPDAGKAMSGSSASRRSSPAESALRLDDQVCPHCGRELEAEFYEFPPTLQRRYEKPGEWYYYPCTPECERKNERREWELARRDARVATLRERSGLSKRMKNYTLGNFKVEATDAARARKKRVPSLFVTVPELLDNLREAYNKPGRNLDEWMDAVQNADFLILDDLGSERVTDWVRERIFVIVNHRYRESLPTIFTSNIGPKDLAQQLGERTASRIIAMCDWIALEGEDYRETAAREGR